MRTEDFEADLDAWGVSEKDRERIAGPKEEGLFDVMEENWAAVVLFCAAITQWRRRPNGSLQGMDYNAVDVTARRLEMNITRQDWANLMIMEKEVLQAVSDG